ncbi:MAG: hypothetical protein L7F78_10055, partial [Syntrophales bacterium LBB04]|nr:hypothetical protein [Syntrophales bacterium LBB04]
PSDLFISGFQRYNFGVIAKAGPAYYVFSLIAGMIIFYCLAILFVSMRNAKDNQEKNRIKYILGGTKKIKMKLIRKAADTSHLRPEIWRNE